MGLLMLASSSKPAQLMDLFFNQLLNFSITQQPEVPEFRYLVLATYFSLSQLAITDLFNTGNLKLATTDYSDVGNTRPFIVGNQAPL